MLPFESGLTSPSKILKRMLLPSAVLEELKGSRVVGSVVKPKRSSVAVFLFPPQEAKQVRENAKKAIKTILVKIFIMSRLYEKPPFYSSSGLFLKRGSPKRGSHQGAEARRTQRKNLRNRKS
jgi:hypothetical protein